MIHIDVTLLEKFANHYSKIFTYPPCVSRILAYLMFDFNKEGVTFDELLHFFDVSKSSISCALKFLEEKGHISSFNKDDSRKRFFKINEQYFINRYNNIYETLMNEKQLFSEIKLFKQTNGYIDSDEDEKLDTLIHIVGKNADNLLTAIQILSKYSNSN